MSAIGDRLNNRPTGDEIVIDKVLRVEVLFSRQGVCETFVFSVYKSHSVSFFI